MPNSDRPRRLRRTLPLPRWLALAALLAPSPAGAQKAPQGFALDRFYASAPGAGWLVMNTLDTRGPLGGVLALSGGYSDKPLRIALPGAPGRLAVVSQQAFADIGLALTLDRFRLYLDLRNPLLASGMSGGTAAYQYTAPAVDLGRSPDLVSDARIGLGARFFGEADGPLRLGFGAELFTPNGDRADYETDDTLRAMFRALFAGDVGRFTYAGHLGVHLRPLDDSPAPGSPRGSELLFGLAAGIRLPAARGGSVILGPEVYGESALRSFLGATTTGVEGLLTARIEGPRGDGPQLRLKMGSGVGIHPDFGAPAFRAVVSVEVSDHVR